jgi:hypothetical protein
MHWSFVLARIVARTAAALWRHRLAWLVVALSASAIGLYGLSYAGPTAANGDCADAAMAAVTSVDDATAHAAYACLGATMRSTTEDAFVAGMHQRDPGKRQVSRVADQRTRDGGRIVFYTVEQQGQAVGYIVYLDAEGKVIRVE